MANALEGGVQVTSNARQALVSFCRNAYPKYTDHVEAKVDLRSLHPRHELYVAIGVLSDKAGGD